MTEQTNRKIIFITELIDQRLRKEKEIEYYEEQLKIIQSKIHTLTTEKRLTETILDIIRNEEEKLNLPDVDKRWLGKGI
jgi:prefoldin subunit 5